MLLLSGRDERDGDFRYAPDKWNAKEVLGHVCDTERIFAYRALRIARGDQTPIEGYEQDDYVKNGPFASAPFWPRSLRTTLQSGGRHSRCCAILMKLPGRGAEWRTRMK